MMTLTHQYKCFRSVNKYCIKIYFIEAGNRTSYNFINVSLKHLKVKYPVDVVYIFRISETFQLLLKQGVSAIWDSRILAEITKNNLSISPFYLQNIVHVKH